MKVFDYLKKKDKSEIIMLGKAYAYDKLAFVKFAEKAWQRKEGDFVRATVACASLLIERPKLSKNNPLEKQIYELNQIYGTDHSSTNKLLGALLSYFDNRKKVNVYNVIKPEIEDAFEKKIEAYKRILNLQKEAERIDKKIVPVLDKKTMAMLKTFNNKNVLLSMYKRKKKTLEREFRVVFTGNTPENFMIKFNGNTIHVVSDISGIASLRDVDTGEYIFKNDIKDAHFNTKFEKYVHLYGYDETIKIMKRNINQLTEVDDENYRRSEKNNKTRKNLLKSKFAKDYLKETDYLQLEEEKEL